MLLFYQNDDLSTTKTEEEFEEEPDEKERIFLGGRDRIRDSDTLKTCALLCFKKTLKNRHCHCFPRSKHVRGVTTYWKNMELLLKILTSPIKGGKQFNLETLNCYHIMSHDPLCVV